MILHGGAERNGAGGAERSRWSGWSGWIATSGSKYSNSIWATPCEAHF